MKDFKIYLKNFSCSPSSNKESSSLSLSSTSALRQSSNAPQQSWSAIQSSKVETLVDIQLDLSRKNRNHTLRVAKMYDKMI